MILIVGATGFMGHEAAKQLVALGLPVRALTRTPEKATDLKAIGVEVTQGDLIDPSSLTQACQGCDAVIDAAHSLMGTGKYSSYNVDLIGKKSLVDAAKAAGVEHFVFTSMLWPVEDTRSSFIQNKRIIEQYVRDSGMNYTILRASAYMEWHAYIFIGKGILESGKTTILGPGEKPVNFISAADVAKFAVIAVTDPKACNCTIEVGGWDNLSKNQVAAMNAKLAGVTPKVSHLPMGMLRVMSMLLKPIKPEVAGIMAISHEESQLDFSFDPLPTLKDFPVELTRLGAFIAAHQN